MPNDSMNNNASLTQRDQQVIWHPFTPLNQGQEAIPVVKGEGIYLITEDGNRYMDAISSWWVNLHGHGHPKIAKAIADQALQLEQVIFANFTHRPAIELAERVLSMLPDEQTRAFYSDDGSTAVEVGLKMAFQYWHNLGEVRKKVIAFEGAYHGDTFGSMAVGDRSDFTAPFAPFLFDVEFLPLPDADNKEAVISKFNSIIEQGDVAAFIFEPLLQGAGGMRMYEASVLTQLIKLAKDKKVICIADEVLTGFGRTGRIFASDHLMAKPDIFCLSKGLTGGAMALSMTTCADWIQEVYATSDAKKTFFHGHSFTANPIACAAANASYELLMEEETQSSLSRIPEQHHEFKRWLDQQSGVRNARVLGTVLAFDLATANSTGYFNEIRHKVTPYFMKKGIFMRPLGNVIYILPPYVITNEELGLIYDAIREFLHDHRELLQST